MSLNVFSLYPSKSKSYERSTVLRSVAENVATGIVFTSAGDLEEFQENCKGKGFQVGFEIHSLKCIFSRVCGHNKISLYFLTVI